MTSEAPPQTDELYEHSRWCMWTSVEPAGTALIIRARSSMGPRTRGRPEPAMSVARSAAEVLRDHVGWRSRRSTRDGQPLLFLLRR